MKKTNKSGLRAIGRAVLEGKGFQTELQTGQGVLAGSRLRATKGDQILQVAVRTSYQRALSFTMQPNGRWRGLTGDRVVLVVPAENNSEGVEVLAFRSTTLKRVFDEAFEDLAQSDRSSRYEIPVFVPLDRDSRKNVGHKVSNLKKSALWTVRLGPDELKSKVVPDNVESFIDRVKREFAERNQVDVSKVEVEFRILK